MINRGTAAGFIGGALLGGAFGGLPWLFIGGILGAIFLTLSEKHRPETRVPNKRNGNLARGISRLYRGRMARTTREQHEGRRWDGRGGNAHSTQRPVSYADFLRVES